MIRSFWKKVKSNPNGGKIRESNRISKLRRALVEISHYQEKTVEYCYCKADDNTEIEFLVFVYGTRVHIVVACEPYTF